MKIPRAKLYIDFFTLIKSFIKILFNVGLKRGPKVKKLESLFENYWGRKNCITTSTCRLSLHYVLESLDLKEGDEVLLTPIQIPDFINVILNLRLKPVFVEIDKQNESIDIDDLKKKINSNSKALLATYLCGIVPKISEISKICNQNDIYLIEDISHSYGSISEQIKAGCFGSAAIGSFSPGKIISSIGGGFILIDDKDRAQHIRDKISNEIRNKNKKTLINICLYQMKISILTSKYIFNFFTYYVFLTLSIFFKDKFHEIHSPKFKFTHKDRTIYDNPPILRNLPNELFFEFGDTQAEVAIKTFHKNINYGLNRRQALAKVLYDNLDESSKNFVPNIITDFDNNAFWHFPIVLKDENTKNDFQKFLLKNGCDLVGYGMRLCSNEEGFKKFKSNFDNADNLHKNSLFFPIFDSISKKDLIRIAKSTNKFFS